MQGSSETLVCECQALWTQPAPDAPAGFRVPVNYCLRANPAGRGLLDLGWTGRRLPAFACSLRASGGKQVKGTASLGWLSKAPTLPPRFDIVWDLYFVTKTCQLCSQTVQANLSSRKHDMDTTMLATLSLSYANMNPDDEMIIMREHEPRMMK